MKSIITILLLSLWSCTNIDPEIKRLRAQADSLKQVEETHLDSALGAFQRLGMSYDDAMMETHGKPYHRGDCKIYKKWAKDKRGE